MDNLTSGVRAGLSLPEALSGIGARGPEPLREPFRQFGSDYRTTGRFNDCLDRLKAALADPVGDRVVESLRVAREVGGTDLGRLLSTLSAFLRDDARTRAELRRPAVLVGERGPDGRRGTLAGAPAARDPAGDAARLRQPDRHGRSSSPGAVLSFVAYRLMIRIGRLPEDRRVLR